LEILKRACKDGFFDEVPDVMVEIVADGHGPDDTIRPSQFVEKQDPPEHGELSPNDPDANTAVLPQPPVPKLHPYQPMQWCTNCDEMTRHVTYGWGTPTWHCIVCCICDLCMATLTKEADLDG